MYYRKKSCNSGLFSPSMVNVATKEYCSICLETQYISEEICIKVLVVVAVAEE